MNKQARWTRSPRVALSAALALASGAARAADALDQPAAPLARDAYDLHIWLMVLCVFIFVAVLAATFYSVVRHRRSAGDGQANFHENLHSEILWTAVPFLILTVMAWPVAQTFHDMASPSGSGGPITLTGRHLERGHAFVTGASGAIELARLPATGGGIRQVSFRGNPGVIPGLCRE